MNEMREEFGTVCPGCGDIGRNRIVACNDMPEGWTCTRCGRAVTAPGETMEEFRRRLHTINWKAGSTHMLTEKYSAGELAEKLMETRRERDALLDCLRLSPNNCDYCKHKDIPARERGCDCDYDCDDCPHPCPCRDCTPAGEHFVWIGEKNAE